MKPSAFLTLIACSLFATFLPGCSDPPAESEVEKPPAPAPEVGKVNPPVPPPPPTDKPEPKKPDKKPASSEFTPIPIEGDFLPLTPRTYTEAEIDELIKGIEIKLRDPSYGRLSFSLRYGPELNLNPGPSGMRPTYEGTELAIDLRSITLKDGTSVEVDRPYGTSQRWKPDEKQFHDSREFTLKAAVDKDTLAKVEGDIVITAAVGTEKCEFVRPKNTSKIKSLDVPIDGLKVTPNWDRRNLEIWFEAGSRNKIVHVCGIDEDGQELLIASVGGSLDRKNPKAGMLSYLFAENGKKLQTIHFYAAPKVIERRIPFDLKMEE